MAVIRLSWRARQTLRRIARSDSDARAVRRAQALLWLDAGESVAAVAQRLGLSRYGVYQIVARFLSRGSEPVGERVRDREHPGRPAAKRQQVRPVLEELLQQPPSQYGYRAFAWTTPMLRHQTERRLGRPLSERTLRRALRDLDYRYKRPRYGLARRAPTWRQVKGGSSEG
ncbi:MAG TPA: helix-turn-helix domain-containing protein [Anaerolineae bacterium]|mgnify:CR=1 FL=1|nr:helix-turn-helix domain-containing protein [Anaerolineae bacterium]HPL30392.1 helix-turn-helix domain-containing protein [Anaerolineae bacterium]